MTGLGGRRVAIVGLGASGIAAARLCLAQGAVVHGYDEASGPVGHEAHQLGAAGVDIHLGPLVAGAITDVDLVVVSPGVPRRPALVSVSERGAEVIGELELGWRFSEAPIGLVGGTNGKSTVTAWVGAMLEAAGKRVFLGGNFGQPLCAAVSERFDALVIEISSFQAERVPTLHARVAALLNITDDHLDRYESAAEYAHAKGNPFANMDEHDLAVLPAGDASCAAQVARGRARQATFSVHERQADVGVAAGQIVDRTRDEHYPIAAIRLGGTHNLANACAAVAVAREMGAGKAAVAAGLAGFDGLAHRNALVAEQDGVRYYDDSKATNVGAAVAALRGLKEPRAVLIAGGRDKQGALDPLAAALASRGRAMVVLGEAAERMADAAEGVVPVHRAASMEEAVRLAARLAKRGDAVLLSPACSSYDMFRSFAERGEVFAAAVVRQLGGGR